MSTRKWIGFALLVTAVAGISPRSAAAWDGTVSGRISSIDVADGANFAFRVVLDGTSACGPTGQGWAYLNEADSNYKVFVATLLSAKASASSVKLYTTIVKWNGYDMCHIGYITVQ